MRLVFMVIVFLGMSACSHLQKPRLPANVIDNLTITIPKKEFRPMGGNRTQAMRLEGTVQTKWQGFIINRTNRKIDDKTSIDCAIEYFGNLEALLKGEVVEATFNSASIPQGHVFPKIYHSISNLKENVSSTRIGLVFTSGKNQNISLVCEKTVIQNDPSGDQRMPINLNDVLAIYPNIHVAKNVGGEPEADPGPSVEK